MHLWHDLHPGTEPAEAVNGLIEIPKGSRDKYELDKELGLLRLDRVLYSAVYYPANYGFIPQTFCDDGDPLDILVLSQASIFPMTVVSTRVIGVMRMLDNNEADDKLIAVAHNDASVDHYRDISDLPPHTTREIRAFFEDYKKLENKTVDIEDFQDRKTALAILDQAIIDYQKQILPKLRRVTLH